MNGVKIAVPVGKMSNEDLEYVEDMTGISLQQEKPSGDSRKSRSTGQGLASPDGGVKVEKNSKPEYDWFQFFLDCNVAVGLCERYAQAFNKDSMDESVLPDVDANILRTLGLREGDIIKVMRTLDAKFGRNRPKDNDGGLFSGPGGTLRNNTRKGRPAPAVQTSDVVDASAFSKKDKPSSGDDEARSPAAISPQPSATAEPKSVTAGGGFEDDAWDVKPSKQPAAAPTKAQSPPPASKATSPPPAALTGSMKELSLLSEPLQPTKTASPPQLPPQPTGASTTSSPQAAQPMPGASPGFFSSMAQQNSAAAARQRPAPPQQTSPLQGSLVPPPPQRPLSAPQSAQPSAYPVPGLTPQMTGLVQGQVAPPGQSLNDITQQRLQQQYTAMQPQYTGFPGQQNQQMQQPQGMMPYQTGNQGQFMQPMMTGMPQQSPFADPGRSNSVPMQPQQTGFQPPFTGQQTGFGQPPQGGINNYLPQPLEPQRTAMQPQQTGFGQTPQQQTPQPLQPQQTGPAPPVRFGVEAKKLAPQATGRKANLAQASK